MDFCGRDAYGDLQLVQVCADLSDPGTRELEQRALAAALDVNDVRGAVLVTAGLGMEQGRQEETVVLGNRAVRLVPAWRWLLEAREQRPSSG